MECFQSNSSAQILWTFEGRLLELKSSIKTAKLQRFDQDFETIFKMLSKAFRFLTKFYENLHEGSFQEYKNCFEQICVLLSSELFIALKIGKNGGFCTFDLCTLFVLSLGEVLHDPATAFCSPGIECATAPSLSSNQIKVHFKSNLKLSTNDKVQHSAAPSPISTLLSANSFLHGFSTSNVILKSGIKLAEIEGAQVMKKHIFSQSRTGQLICFA